MEHLLVFLHTKTEIHEFSTRPQWTVFIFYDQMNSIIESKGHYFFTSNYKFH
jgi:hypothetical protein